jgi:hypothetical protein
MACPARRATARSANGQCGCVRVLVPCRTSPRRVWPNTNTPAYARKVTNACTNRCVARAQRTRREPTVRRGSSFPWSRRIETTCRADLTPLKLQHAVAGIPDLGQCGYSALMKLRLPGLIERDTPTWRDSIVRRSPFRNRDPSFSAAKKTGAAAGPQTAQTTTDSRWAVIAQHGVHHPLCSSHRDACRTRSEHRGTAQLLWVRTLLLTEAQTRRPHLFQ